MDNASQSPRKKLLWSLLFVVIAVGTVWAVIAQGRAISLRSLAAYVSGMSLPWLAAAVAAALCFVIFEGEAVIAVCRAFGCHPGRRRGFVYAASDIYFSAITPSASGGQPACAYFMIRDGIPPAATTIALLANLTLYVASILIIGVGNLILHPDIFESFGTLSKVLIAFGYATQALLAAFFVLLLIRGELLHALLRKALRLLCRLRLLKREEDKLRSLDRHMEEYRSCARMMREHKGRMLQALVCNLLQRAAVISVPLFVYLAAGGGLDIVPLVWAVQCFAVIGSNTIPIPGAMGVSDYIMLDGFGNLMSERGAVHFELFSRALSFYGCVLLCGAVTLFAYLRLRGRGARK